MQRDNKMEIKLIINYGKTNAVSLILLNSIDHKIYK